MTLDAFDIRYTEMDDLSFLEDYFSNHEALDPFPFEEMEKKDALKNWIGFSRFKASLTGTWNNEPCALATLFLMPYKKVSHHASFWIVVDPAKRRLGIGSSMVKNLLHLAKTRFRLETVNIEVFEDSDLSFLLKKMGFSPMFRQENFVKIEGKKKAREVWERSV